MHTRPLIRHRMQTRSRSQLVDMTDDIAAVVAREKITSGVVIVYMPHTTAGVTINENADPDVKHDLLRKLEELIPQREAYYRHGDM